MYKVKRTDEYLKHHGILGQRWGKKNGPPYPLEQSDRSPKEQRLNSKSKSSINKSSDDEKEHKRLTDGQKKAIKIGSIAAGTALVAIGGVYLYKTGKLQSIGKRISKQTINGDVGKVFNLKKINRPTNDAHKIAETVNKRCFNKKWDIASINNCKENALGFYLRKQLGLDAVSPPRVVEGNLRDFVEHVATNNPESVVSVIKTNSPTGLKYKGRNAQETASNFIKSQILKGKYKEGDCGAFGITELGHTIAFYIENGEPKFQNIFQVDSSHKATDWFKLASNDFEFQVCNFANLNLIMDVVNEMYK